MAAAERPLRPGLWPPIFLCKKYAYRLMITHLFHQARSSWALTPSPAPPSPHPTLPSPRRLPAKLCSHDTNQVQILHRPEIAGSPRTPSPIFHHQPPLSRSSSAATSTASGTPHDRVGKPAWTSAIQDDREWARSTANHEPDGAGKQILERYLANLNPKVRLWTDGRCREGDEFFFFFRPPYVKLFPSWLLFSTKKEKQGSTTEGG